MKFSDTAWIQVANRSVCIIVKKCLKTTAFASAHDRGSNALQHNVMRSIVLCAGTFMGCLLQKLTPRSSCRASKLAAFTVAMRTLVITGVY